MKKTAVIICFLFSFSMLGAQNYGYFGRKNVVYGGVHGGTGFLTGAVDELRIVYGFERSLLRKLSFFAEFQQQKAHFDQKLNSGASLILRNPDNTEDWLSAVHHYAADLQTKAAVFGIKYFMGKTGGIAPLGPYLTVSADYSMHKYSNGVVDGEVWDYRAGSLYKNFHFAHLPERNFNTLFTNLGFGATRIFANRIVTDFSFGMSVANFNTGPFTFVKFSHQMDIVTYNPQDWLMMRMSFLTSNSRTLWVKYKLGFLF